MEQWYSDGSPKTEMMMSNDKPTEIISWDENGRIVSELSIRNGKRSGIILDWYDDGAKKSELVYKDDQLVKKPFGIQTDTFSNNFDNKKTAG